MKILTYLMMSLSLVYGTQAYAKKERKQQQQWMKELNLTKEQRSKIKEIRQGSKEQMKSLREEKKQLKNELKEKMQGDASEGQLRSQFKALQSKRNEMDTVRFENLLKIRQVLSPDQRKKMRMHFQDSKKKGKWGKKRKGHHEEEE